MRIAGETHFTFASAKGAGNCERFVFFVSEIFSVGAYTAKKVPRSSSIMKKQRLLWQHNEDKNQLIILKQSS